MKVLIEALPQSIAPKHRSLSAADLHKPSSLSLSKSLFFVVLLTCAVTFFGSRPAAAVTHSASHTSSKGHRVTVRRHLRYVKWNPMFPGSHDLLVKQNEELDRLQLPRIENDEELERYELTKALVPISDSDALKVAEDLPDNRRYCRSWTLDFLQDFSQAFYSEFHTPIQVNSAVRTVQQQRRLRRHNRFAAPEIGDTASTHLTGVTVDLSRRGLTRQEYDWIRNYLLPLKEAGLIDPIEERQPVLHVVVFQQYSNRLDDVQGWSEADEPTENSGINPDNGGGSQP